MSIESFEEMYVAELHEACSVERQLTAALPEMAGSAAHGPLRETTEAHLAEACSHLDRVERLLANHTAPRDSHEDQSMRAMIGDDVGRDAGLVASARRVEHYGMAIDGTLAAWARQLGPKDDAETLHAIPEEERAADATLSDVARRLLNPEAAQ